MRRPRLIVVSPKRPKSLRFTKPSRPPWDARTDFAASEEQYEIAAQRFRTAEGPLSQNAIIAELMRENTQMRTQLPSYIEQARQGFKAQQQLISRLPEVTPELQAWRALAESGSLIYSPYPEQALPILHSALERAKKLQDSILN